MDPSRDNSPTSPPYSREQIIQLVGKILHNDLKFDSLNHEPFEDIILESSDENGCSLDEIDWFHLQFSIEKTYKVEISGSIKGKTVKDVVTKIFNQLQKSKPADAAKPKE